MEYEDVNRWHLDTVRGWVGSEDTVRTDRVRERAQIAVSLNLRSEYWPKECNESVESMGECAEVGDGVHPQNKTE